MKSKFLVILIMIMPVILLYACSETGLEYGKDNINNGSNSNNGSNNNSNNNNGANNGNNSNNNDSNNNNSGSGGSNNEGGSSNGGGNSNNGGSQVELSFDEKYPNMKVGVHSFNEIDGKISEEERLEVAKKFAVIRTLFNTKEFINVIKENYADFNSRDEGKYQEIEIRIPTPNPEKPDNVFNYKGILGVNKGEATDGKPDGGCWVINPNFPQIKPCGSYLGFNYNTKINYFLSNVDQTSQEYKHLKYYNAPFAQKKYRDLLDMNRMLDIFANVNYNIKVGKQDMTGYDRAEQGPYRYLMDLDDESLKTTRFINMPDKNWMDGVGGGVDAVLMHGIMHNLGFHHVSDTKDFGLTISPVSAIAQYIKYEGPKLENAQAPYDKPEIQAKFKEIKDEYQRRYGNL